MLNVADLEPQWFTAILDGTKRTQCRLRRRIDPRVEAITPGERIALLEIGSDRVIRATVSGVKRTRHDYGYRYAIAFSDICAARSVEHEDEAVHFGAARRRFTVCRESLVGGGNGDHLNLQINSRE